MSDNEDDDLPGKLKIRLSIQKSHKLRQLILAKNVKPAVVVRKVSFEKFYDMDRDSELGKGAFAVVRKCTQKDTGKSPSFRLLRFQKRKRGTHLAYFQHIIAARNLNYGITEICSIFQLCHNSNFPLLKYASNMPFCAALKE